MAAVFCRGPKGAHALDQGPLPFSSTPKMATNVQSKKRKVRFDCPGVMDILEQLCWIHIGWDGVDICFGCLVGPAD